MAAQRDDVVAAGGRWSGIVARGQHLRIRKLPRRKQDPAGNEQEANQTPHADPAQRPQVREAQERTTVGHRGGLPALPCSEQFAQQRLAVVVFFPAKAGSSSRLR